MILDIAIAVILVVVCLCIAYVLVLISRVKALLKQYYRKRR